MARRSDRNFEKREKRIESLERKYYDACALRLTVCQKEIRNSEEQGFIGMTSFLGLGECISHIIIDAKDKEDAERQIQPFVRLIYEQQRKNCLELVTAERVTEEILSIFDIIGKNVIDVADAHHLAIALSHKCVRFITTDRDLYGLTEEKQQELKEKFGIPNFSVEKRELDD